MAAVKKMAEDETYRAVQRESQTLWREQNPDYWRGYRKTHPEYVERNRLLQKVRDARAKSSHLAKMDASAPDPILISGTYHLIPPLAKMNAFRRKVHLITSG